MTEKEIIILSKELEYMNKNIQDLYEILKNHIEKEEAQMEKLLDRLDKKYSWKWVEKIVGGAVGMILVSVFSALIYLVIQK